MNRNLLLGVVGVSVLLGAAAMLFMGPDTGEPMAAPVEVPAEVPQDGPRPIAYTPPPAPAPRNLRPDRPGLRANLPEPTHDFAKTYDPSPEGLREAVEAREQRIRACLGVHGMPRTEDPEVLEVFATLSEGDESGGKADIESPDAHYELAGCLSMALEDANFPNPEIGNPISIQVDLSVPTP